jgi:hypothetical protein
MSVPDPFNFPALWDTIYINGMPWGGQLGSGALDPSYPMFAKIRIEGATRFYKVDQKDGQGLDGATQTFRGVKPKPFKLIFSWYTAAQHTYWALFSYQFIYTGSKVVGIPPVFSVSHPALALLYISAILIDEVGQVEINEDTKLARAVVTARQFYPPPPVAATATPTSAPPAPAPPGSASTVTAEQALLQALLITTQTIANAGLAASYPH